MFRIVYKNCNHSKKLIWVIAGAVLTPVLIFVSVFYMGRNQSKQTSHVTLMFSEAPEDIPLSGVSFELAAGYDNPSGEVAFQIVTGDAGTADFDVPEGEYTLRWQAEGYYVGYQNVTVQGETFALKKRLLPYIEDGSAYIFLEWGAERNLDLCVYYEESGRCIGIEPTMDAEGCFLYDDNNGDQGYELVYLKNAAIGNYRIYVKDCDSILNDRESRMEAEGVTVSIYTAQGVVYQKSAEVGENASLWECAGLCCGDVAEQDQYLYDLTDYAWALRDGDDPASWLDEACIRAEEVYNYDSKGGLDQIRRTEYDECGNEISFANYSADGLIYRNDYEYDENGNKTAYSNYDADSGVAKRHEYEYDENGNWTAEYVCYIKRFDPTHRWDQPVKIREREFSEDGNLIRDYHCDTNGLPVHQYEFEYDTEGNEIRTYYCNYTDGEFDNSEERRYEYDAEGNLIREYSCMCEYMVWGAILREEYQLEYDTDGKQTVRIHSVDGRMLHREEYQYDGDGNETVRYVYNYSEGREYLDYSRECEYDENGNLLVSSKYVYSVDGEDDRVLTGQNIFEYDVYGNRIVYEMCWYSPYDGTLYLRSKEEYAANGKRTTSYLYRYDGNEVSSVSGDEYEYDERGNMTAHCHYENGVITQLDIYKDESVSVYDARAGMEVTYYYANDCFIKKTITIYDFQESTAEN